MLFGLISIFMRCVDIVEVFVFGHVLRNPKVEHFYLFSNVFHEKINQPSSNILYNDF